MVPAGGDGSRALAGTQGYSGQPVPHFSGVLSFCPPLLVAELAVECLAPAPADGIRYGTDIVILSAKQLVFR